MPPSVGDFEHRHTRVKKMSSWPLGPGVTAEVRFCGLDLAPMHVELLREYLHLVKRALSRAGTGAP
jgi:hypothetical protein